MDRYCVVGNPVAHSRSPWIHARFAQLTGQSLQYDRLLVEPTGFVRALADLRAAGARGCNVTVPFKFDAAAAATQATARARLAGACNTLRFDGESVFADNTDGVGLVRDIEGNAGVTLRGADMLLVGAGGAAAGVLGPLLEAGPRRIVLANRTAEKAIALAHRHVTLAAQHRVELVGVALDA
ncbi:MAG: shikimate dehydrogenase, partial [Ramlibacter sp.]